MLYSLPPPFSSDLTLNTEIKMRTQFRSALILLSILALTGCNTMAGIGKDVESGGQKIQDAAESTKSKM